MTDEQMTAEYAFCLKIALGLFVAGALALLIHVWPVTAVCWVLALVFAL